VTESDRERRRDMKNKMDDTTDTVRWCDRCCSLRLQLHVTCIISQTRDVK
jgi:hypothetical protein